MIKDPHSDIFTVGIGGAAGDGVREAGQSLGQLLTELGYEVFVSFTYPSLIKGGHNFSRVSFGSAKSSQRDDRPTSPAEKFREKIYCDHSKLDALIALNEETVRLHRAEMNSGAVIFADSFPAEDISALGENAVAVPMTESAKKIGAPAIARNSVALGAACYLLDLHFPIMQKILAKVFKDKAMDANVKLADIGFEHLKKLNFRHPKKLEPAKHAKELVDGNMAFARGLQAAGLDFYVSYPMTPATSILHFLAKEVCPVRSFPEKTSNGAGAPNSKLKVIQPENEISAINMALGMAYAGARAAIGSATGGFALMQEAFSFSGMAELPLAIAVSQRQAPATGVPTYSSQTDLKFAIHSGHGEFPRIVLLPGDAEEAFYAGASALNLAWKYQIPVIALLDKIISEHSETVKLDASKIKIEQGKLADLSRFGKSAGQEKIGADYGRYEITPDGISPMAFPGAPKAVVKITSYEHDSRGITAEEAEPVKAMIDKRFAKAKTILQEFASQETVKIYGEKSAETAIVFWGSTKGAVLEASKYFDKPAKLVQILWAEPFDAARVSAELRGAKKIIDIECNHDGQMAALIREKTGIDIADKILKYDSRPFEPMELANKINSLLK